MNTPAFGLELKKLRLDDFNSLILSHALPDESRFIQFVEDRPFNDQSYVISDAKIKKLGWCPKVSFEEGILKTITWYQTTNVVEYFKK